MTDHSPTVRPVLVGTDGSDESRAAVRWAADEAQRLDVPLHVVHSWLWPYYDVPLGRPLGAPPGAGLQAAAKRVLAEAVAEAKTIAPATPLESSLLVGAPAAQLMRAAQNAQLLVVGNRGLGGFTALLLGSVGITVAACAPSSVVVVRGPQSHPEGPVVVGVDGSPRGAAALVTAFQEASRRGVGVMVVHAWTFPLHLEAVDDGYEALYAEGRRAGQELLDKSVAEATASFPDVEVELRLGDRSSAAELVAASDDAQLVVVGTRGLGGLRGALLGSTTHALLHHAACPVFVHRAG